MKQNHINLIFTEIFVKKMAQLEPLLRWEKKKDKNSK